MKRLLAFLAMGILFYACSENTSLIDPVETNSVSAVAAKPDGANVNWLTMNSTKANQLVMDQEAVLGGNFIDLSVGGVVRANFRSRDGLRTISATLHVPAGAVKDRRYFIFAMIVDNTTMSVKFMPHPTFFDIPCTFDLEYTGVDLRGIDPKTVSFAYLDDPKDGFVITSDQIYTNVATGTLSISGVEIPHFSEYGFVRKDNPEAP